MSDKLSCRPVTDRDVLRTTYDDLVIIAGMSSSNLTEAGQKQFRERIYELVEELRMYLGYPK